MSFAERCSNGLSYIPITAFNVSERSIKNRSACLYQASKTYPVTSNHGMFLIMICMVSHYRMNDEKILASNSIAKNI